MLMNPPPTSGMASPLASPPAINQQNIQPWAIPGLQSKPVLSRGTTGLGSMMGGSGSQAGGQINPQMFAQMQQMPSPFQSFNPQNITESMQGMQPGQVIGMSGSPLSYRPGAGTGFSNSPGTLLGVGSQIGGMGSANPMAANNSNLMQLLGH